MLYSQLFVYSKLNNSIFEKSCVLNLKVVNQLLFLGEIKMKQLYVKQKVFSAAEKFTVRDTDNQIHYYIKGSLFNAPKTFEIQDAQHNIVAQITKKVLAFLPKFIIESRNNPTVEIKKELSLLRPHYTFSPQNITVKGDLFEMNFSILNKNEEIATIHKKILSWGDAYEITILEQQDSEDSLNNEILVVGLVVAIYYMLAQDRSQV